MTDLNNLHSATSRSNAEGAGKHCGTKISLRLRRDKPFNFYVHRATRQTTAAPMSPC
jgi:hypothetical protein